MAYDRELLQRQILEWARHKTPRNGETRDARPAVRNLHGENEHAFDGNGLFYDQSGDAVAGVDD